MRITAEKIQNRWMVLLNGVGYSPLEVSKKYGIGKHSLGIQLSRLTSEGFEIWLNNRIDLYNLGLNPQVKLFRRGKEICWADPIIEQTGYHRSYISRQLKRWENKDIDCDELWAPIGIRLEKQIKNKPDWGNLNLGPRKKISDVKSTWVS